MALDMRDTILCVCNADRHTLDTERSHGLGYHSLRDMLTVADMLRWYAQSPQEDDDDPRS